LFNGLFVTLKKAFMNTLNRYVEVRKDMAGNAPVFKGTRVTIKTLFDHLEEESLEEFLIGFPTVTREQAEGVIEMAAEKIISEFTV
jgi:uncharacterized protein (DUF433 family)